MTFLKKIKSSIKTKYLIFKDQLEVLLGKRHPLMPPKRYDYINIGANTEINKEFFRYFVELGGVKKDDYILEVGSGFGRMAIPFTDFLSHKGHYEGLELIKDGVNWCQSNFNHRYPNFNFQRIDVKNERYHPSGKQKASDYNFPFNDQSFDFVYLTSVFTHMYPEEIENYLKEISRVLKHGGHCLITYYLLNDISINNITKNRGVYNFKHQIENYYVEDITNPLYQIAFKEDFIKTLYKNAILKLKTLFIMVVGVEDKIT